MSDSGTTMGGGGEIGNRKGLVWCPPGEGLPGDELNSDSKAGG